jgi:hypothetical protein
MGHCEWCYCVCRFWFVEHAFAYIGDCSMGVLSDDWRFWAWPRNADGKIYPLPPFLSLLNPTANIP